MVFLAVCCVCAAGLNRTGKSCRLRWVNYLHPGLKHGRMSAEEEQLVLDLHEKYGNRFNPMAHLFNFILIIITSSSTCVYL